MSDMELQPLYQRVAHHYRGAIRSGVLSPGERMPSVRSLTRLHRRFFGCIASHSHTRIGHRQQPDDLC